MTSAPALRDADVSDPRSALEQRLLSLETRRSTDLTGDEQRVLGLERQAEEIGAIDLLQRARLLLGGLRERLGNVAAAGNAARDVHAWATAEDDRYVLARSERLLATFYDRIGDVGSALEHAVRAVELLEEDAHPRVRAEHLMELAVAQSRRPDTFDAARQRYRQILVIAEELGDGDLKLRTLNNLAFVEVLAGNVQASTNVAREMQACADRLGTRLYASHLDTLARVLMLSGDYASAEQLLAPVLLEDGAGLIAEGDDLPELLLTLAECQRLRGHLDQAEQSLQRSEQVCRERQLDQVLVRVLQEKAALLCDQGDHLGAYRMHQDFHAKSQALYSAEQDARAKILVTVYETEEAVRSSKHYREMSLRDPLTSMYNRRFVDDHVPGLLDHAAAHAEHLAVAILDLDHFKLVNDTFSHEVGDDVLVALAGVLEDSTPGEAFAARLGGEEFLLVLPGYDVSAAAELCEALRVTVQDHAWVDVHAGLSVTASIGVAATFAGSTSLSHLLGQADQRLYSAKRQGRNRVVSG